MLASLTDAFPGLAGRVLDGGEVPPFLNIYLDGVDIARLSGLDTTVHASSTIIILPAMAGGSTAGPHSRLLE